MRLIDANRLTEEFLSWTMCDGASMYEIERTIDEQPTVDAEPVRHGRWGGEEIFPGFPTLNGYLCSNCNCRKRAGRKTNYCPNCGAKMDEEGLL